MNQLENAGYKLLTRTSQTEVDTFVKQENKLFVFLQGHPEYESDTLLREYRRDVGRYLKGDTIRYPLLPENYFSYETDAELRHLEQQFTFTRHQELPYALSEALSKTSINNTWRVSAAGMYENWLRYIRMQKHTTRRSKSAPAPSLTAATLTSSAVV